MKVLYTKEALKDVQKLKDQRIKDKLYIKILEIKAASTLKDIKAIKKLSGHPGAFRIRLGQYRLGIYYENDTLLLARFLKRNDIYKVFP